MCCSGRDRTIDAETNQQPIPDGSEHYDMRFWPVRDA